MASDGRKERKRRAVLARGEKGLKRVLMPVRKRVIIFVRCLGKWLVFRVGRAGGRKRLRGG